MDIHFIYNWLINHEPKTEDELRDWKNLAETFLMHAQMPTTMITKSHVQEIRRKANNYKLFLTNHWEVLWNDKQTNKK